MIRWVGTDFKQELILEIFRAGQRLDLGPTFNRRLHYRIAKHFYHDIDDLILLRDSAVNFSRDQNGVWRCDKGVFGDGLANVAERDL